MRESIVSKCNLRSSQRRHKDAWVTRFLAGSVTLLCVIIIGHMKEFMLSGGAPDVPKIDYQNELNAEQLEVVLNGDGPCLVLAGAGSGKTRTITYRVAYLLEQGVRPDEILLLTFTNKAAKEMMERITHLLGSVPYGLWGGTFHSIGNRILRQYANVIGYQSNFTIMDHDDSVDLVKIVIKDLKIDTKEKRFPSAAVVHAIISYSRNAKMSIEETVETKYSQFVDDSSTIARIAAQYESRKRTGNTMDFDDLLLLLADLLATNPQVKNALATRFRYVLVDEYQDTNVIQARLVNDLSSVHRNLLVVGDDAQSIYSFRAAEIRNILGFPNAHSGAKTFRLETNYRSTPEILSLANSIIEQNTDQFSKELIAVRDAFEKPNLIPTSDTRQEAQYISEQIVQMIDKGMPLSEIAVLFRAAHHSQALEMELSRRNIPYEFRGGMKFFERAHIKDVVSYIRLIANPKDGMAWIRVLSHQVGIGAVTATKIMEVMQNFESIAQALEADSTGFVPGRSSSGWRSLTSVLNSMHKTDRQPSSLIRIVATSAYQDYLNAEYPNAAERLEDIEQFAIFSEQYSDLSQFLEEVSLKDDYGAVQEEGGYKEERMILSTIHQAKGLEWNAVFVMNLTDGAFPHPRALSEAGGIEEERRLFYVATTRARKHLFLTYPITSGYETMEVRQPSMFLDELPKGLLEEVRVKRPAASYLSSPRDLGSKSRWGESSDEEYDEPTIVLDGMGEVKKAPPRTGFLRSIDEL